MYDRTLFHTVECRLVTNRLSVPSLLPLLLCKHEMGDLDVHDDDEAGDDVEEVFLAGACVRVWRFIDDG